MMITPGNYIEYFHLYVDGELTPDQMKAVDAFCRLHPHLDEELQCLLETRLDLDELPAFPAKDALLKREEWDADALTPQQTAMLEMLDGEAVHAALAGDIVLQHSLQQEWKLLQQTRLAATQVEAPLKVQWIRLLPWNADQLTQVQQQLLEALESNAPLPDTLLQDIEMQKEWQCLRQTLLAAEPADEMPGKAKLYRKAETPVRKMGWWRMAAAAAVLAGIGWILSDTLMPTPGDAPVIVQQTPVTEPGTGNPILLASDSGDKKIAPVPEKETPLLVMNAHQKTPSPKTRETEATALRHPPVQPQQDNQMAREIAAFRLDEMHTNAVVDSERNPGKDLQGSQNAPHKVKKQPDANLMMLAANKDNKEDEMMMNYAATNLSEMDEEEYTTIAGVRVKTQRFRGVFRTVSRNISRSFNKSNEKDVEASELR